MNFEVFVLGIGPYIRDIGLLPADLEQAVRVIGRLALAMGLGALIGWEREKRGRAAGLRTHILVALGSALFTVVAMEAVEADTDRALIISTLVRGVAAGIGFLGAGAIIKGDEDFGVRGLTTAASIWLTAAAGLAVGVGSFWMAAVATAFTWLVLEKAKRLEAKVKSRKAESQEPEGGEPTTEN